jgi:hypothetical protein
MLSSLCSELVEGHFRVDSKSRIEPFCGDMQNPPYSGVGSEVLESYAESRGWIDLPTTPIELGPHMTLFILSYPMGEPLKLSLHTDAVIRLNENRTRVLYRISTAAGSAGAPCFDPSFNLVAMHLGSDGKVNFGTPFTAILDLLRQRGHTGWLGGTKV